MFVAAGDVDGDGFTDTVTGPGAGGGPHVRAFNGRDGHLLADYFAFNPLFPGGVYVAVGDVNGEGRADLITAAGAGGGPHVRVFSGATSQSWRPSSPSPLHFEAASGSEPVISMVMIEWT